MLDPKIETLLQVYERGSFVKAAEQLNITQPAVSHHIKLLEDELGVKLFDRTNGHLKITKSGEEVVKCAKKMQGFLKDDCAPSALDYRIN